MRVLYHWTTWEATHRHLWEATILITIPSHWFIYLVAPFIYTIIVFLLKCFIQNVTFMLCGFLVVFWLMYHFQWINSIMIQSVICLLIFIIHLSNYLFTVLLVQEADKKEMNQWWLIWDSLDVDWPCFLPYRLLKISSKIQNIGWPGISPPQVLWFVGLLVNVIKER